MHSLWEEWIDVCVGKSTSLKFITDRWNPKIYSIVEIGVYRGAFSHKLRKLFPQAHLYLVDPWEIYPDYLSKKAGPITDLAETLEAAYGEVKKRFSSDPQVSIIKLPSAEAAKQLHQTFDLIYIDGNHAYEYVRQDIEMWLPKLNPGGILAGDDYAHDLFPGVCQAVDEKGFSDLITFPSGVWATRSF